MENVISEWLSYDRVIGLYFIFNCMVSAMPDPDDKSTTFYVWFFKFLHTFAGNLNLTRKSYPSPKRPVE